MTNTELVKQLAESLGVKISVVDEPQGKCCVDEPPDSAVEVYLVQELKDEYLDPTTKEDRFSAYYMNDDDTWNIRGGRDGNREIEFPRSAMSGIRWVEIE